MVFFVNYESRRGGRMKGGLLKAAAVARGSLFKFVHPDSDLDFVLYSNDHLELHLLGNGLYGGTGWCRVIGCFKFQVIFAKEPQIIGLFCGK